MNTIQSKEKRISQFNELKELFDSNIYNQDLVFSKPEVISFVINQQKNEHKQFIHFSQENVIKTIEQSNNSAVLVFCSAKNPGGGVTRGSIAQEEEIALHSSWYFQVKELDEFYADKGDSALNTDKIIYIEQGYLLKDDNFNDIEPLKISFIGSTAPNLNGLKDQKIKITEKEIYNTLEKRIANILNLATLKNKSELILGAFGCGVFGLDPVLVSQIFKKKIDENLFSGHITFSILDEKTMNIFKETFKNELPNDCKYIKKIGK